MEIDKNVSAADLTFDVLVSQKGHETSFRVDLEGELLSRELELPAAPLAVRMAITNEVPGGQVVSLDENFEPEVNSFDVEAVATNGVSHSFQLAEDGTLLSREVAWSEVFPPARRTIKLQLEDGKILRIDRWTSKQVSGVYPYEVTGRKDGQDYNFLVGPFGRFLGLMK